MALHGPRVHKSQLMDDDGGCEGSILNVNGIIYFMEPTDKGRTKMTMHCSKDQGKTWNSQITVNGDNKGGYSDMIALPSGIIVAVWEDGSHPLGQIDTQHRHHHHHKPSDSDAGNFYSAQINTTWCV